MATNKYYTTEEIEFFNGDTTSARPLPIKPLKALQAVFEEYADDMRRLATIMGEVQEKTRELSEKKEDPEAYLQEQKDRTSGLMSWNDCLCQGSLIALEVWKVKNSKKQPVQVDMDYVEETLDVPTAQRICEIAGNFKTGDLDMKDPDDVGKALEA